jgi:hypothetical protein
VLVVVAVVREPLAATTLVLRVVLAVPGLQIASRDRLLLTLAVAVGAALRAVLPVPVAVVLVLVEQALARRVLRTLVAAVGAAAPVAPLVALVAAALSLFARSLPVVQRV